jgi:hypothetical protein
MRPRMQSVLPRLHPVVNGALEPTTAAVLRTRLRRRASMLAALSIMRSRMKFRCHVSSP